MLGNGGSGMKAKDVGLPEYFDMQAELGHTKHVGGWFATQELAELCNLGPGQEVLYIGSGSGTAAVKLALEYGCRVVGVDLLERMVERAQARAEAQGMQDSVVFQVADAQELPFEEARFDVVLCESVNTFIRDLDVAASEYVRVVKPGGYVGLNEAVWIEDPPEHGEQLMRSLTGQEIRRSREWVAMLEGAGLEELVERSYEVDMPREARSQFEFLGYRDYLRIFWRFFVQFIFDPGTRRLMRLALNEPRSAYDYMGYGIYVGRKPLRQRG
jgi:ubiquinone/menaquinone biosynthesis C-methylase UbiE